METGRINKVSTRISLINKAFLTASKAEEPIKRIPIPESQTDTESGFLAIAYDLNLDTLSLQSRAVTDMLTLNPTAAREMFQHIELPHLSPLTCDVPLAYDPSAYYQALGAILRRGFSIKERAEDRRLIWAAPYVRNIQSHSQLAPLAKALDSSDPSATELEEYVTLLTSALRQLRGDERSFASAALSAGEDGIVSAMSRLIATVAHNGIPTGSILGALREYLMLNFNQLHCRDAVSADAMITIPTAFSDFNKEFRRALVQVQLSPIAPNDLKHSRTFETDVVYHPLWQSQEAKALFTSLKELRFQGNTERTMTDRQSPEWAAQFVEFIAHLNSWSESGESGTDFVQEKSILYEGLIDITPPSPQRLEVLDRYVEFLQDSAVQDSKRIVWFWHAKGLLEGYRATDYRAEVLDAFLNSQDSTLQTYARFERFMGPHTPLPGQTAIDQVH